MTEELKSNIIETMQSMHKQIGETVKIDDWICTSGNHYDRHQTRFSKYLIKIQDFYIRTSGAIATIYNENQQIEFRTDSINKIEKTENEIILEINMTDNVWRKLKISKTNPVDNIV